MGASSETHRGRSPWQPAREDAPCPTTVRRARHGKRVPSSKIKDPHKSHKRLNSVLPLHYAPVQSGREESNLHLSVPSRAFVTLLPWGAGLVPCKEPVRVAQAVRWNPTQSATLP